MVVLTDLTIRCTFDQEKKNKQNVVKKKEIDKLRTFGGSDATNMLFVTVLTSSKLAANLVKKIRDL